METRTIFFVGKPGCGKGTQAKLLAQTTGWPVFGSGKLFRELEREETPVGRKLKENNEAGLLSPPWFAMYLYLKSLFSIAESQSVIFDGFNRKLYEAELNIESLKWLGRPFQVINVAVSDGEIRKRLKLRAQTSGRADDGDAVIEERIKEFYAYTAPSIELFHKEGVLIEINGEQSPEAIAADVRKALALPAQAGI